MPFKFPKPTRAREKRQKAAHHRRETADLREKVMARARGRCECCGLGGWLELDHWVGGSGRRREQQSVETVWLLSREHHAMRSHNNPSVAEWNRRFAAHCGRHGYAFVPHVEKQPLGAGVFRRRSAP